MTDAKQHLEAIQDIKQMMERSSRFISLSGWSGIAAGVCALVGAYFAYDVIGKPPYWHGKLYKAPRTINYNTSVSLQEYMGSKLFTIAILTFVAALISAFVFTYIRSRKKGIPIWTTSSRRLIISVSIPMLAGAIYLMKLIDIGTYGMIAPGCLIFYGLALLNGSKYTIGEIRYLGYGQLILGFISCWFIGYGLYFWAMGFGVLHIFYGAIMWWKYERK